MEYLEILGKAACVGGFLFGLVIFVSSLMGIVGFLRKYKWVKTTGTVVNSRIENVKSEKFSDRRHGYVSFLYAVDNTWIRNECLIRSYNEYQPEYENFESTFLPEYPEGKQVTVYYLRDDPGVAQPNAPQINENVLGMGLMGLFLMAVFGFACFWILKEWLA